MSDKPNLIVINSGYKIVNVRNHIIGFCTVQYHEKSFYNTKRQFPLPDPSKFRCSLFSAILACDISSLIVENEFNGENVDVSVIIRNDRLYDIIVEKKYERWELVGWPKMMKKNRQMILTLADCISENNVTLTYCRPNNEDTYLNVDKLKDSGEQIDPSNAGQMEKRLNDIKNVNEFVSELVGGEVNIGRLKHKKNKKQHGKNKLKANGGNGNVGKIEGGVRGAQGEGEDVEGGEREVTNGV